MLIQINKLIESEFIIYTGDFSTTYLRLIETIF